MTEKVNMADAIAGIRKHNAQLTRLLADEGALASPYGLMGIARCIEAMAEIVGAKKS